MRDRARLVALAWAHGYHVRHDGFAWWAWPVRYGRPSRVPLAVAVYLGDSAAEAVVELGVEVAEGWAELGRWAA